MGSLTGKGLQINKSDLKNALGQPPPEGLVPIGDMGIYISPHVKEDKPVSPFDCENYPDSPYCGGQPFTKTPVGIDLEFTANKCGGSITGTPILGFTKLPPISVAWIAPECRAEYGKRKQQPPPPDGIDNPPEGLNLPNNIDPETQAIALIICTSYSDYSRSFGVASPEEGGTTTTSDGYLDLTQFWNSYEQLGVRGVEAPGFVICSCFVGGNRVSFSKKEGQNAVRVFQYYAPVPGRIYAGERNGKDTDPYKIARGGFSSLLMEPHGFLLKGRWGDIYKNWNGYKYFYSFSGSSLITYTKAQYSLVSLVTDKSGPPTPDDDYKKRKCCEMPCCDSGQAQQRQRDQDNYEILALLREINKKIGNFPVKVNIFDANENGQGAQSKSESLGSVAQAFFRTISEIEKALKCIGIDQLPIYTPSSVIDNESDGVLGDLGDLANNIFKQRIESIAEMLIWKTKNDYEIFGKWQETITIEDSDPTKKGNQPKKIVLPNMARTFRELVLLNSTQIKVQGMMFDTLLKLYIDVANTKVSTATCEAILRDVQDYLDYPTEVKALDVPLGISIPSDNTPNDDKEDLERFLRNSIAKSKFDDWTGEGSMTEMLTLLLRMAEGYLGQNFGKI